MNMKKSSDKDTLNFQENTLNFQIVGHHLELTPALEQYVKAKFHRLSRFFEKITDIHVTLKVVRVDHKPEQQATARILLPPKMEISAESTEEDMYAAIDTLVDKLERQVVEHKEKLIDRRRKESPYR